MHDQYTTRSASSVASQNHPVTPESPGAHIRGAAYLGIYTNFVSPSPDSRSKVSSAEQRVIDRFRLQSLARQALPGERVAMCLRARINRAAMVSVWHSPERQRAWYGNLVVCGSVWHCPVCASRISEGRRNELTAMLAAARMQGVYPVMITYTLQHGVTDKLVDVLAALLAAIRRVKQGKAWVTAVARWGMLGSINALEVTWGQAAGWHPHRHELMMLDHQPVVGELDELQYYVSRLYGRALGKLGFWASGEYGVSVDFDSGDPYGRVAGYISKYGHLPEVGADPLQWTAAHELTKALLKRAQVGHYAPFEILAYSGDHPHARALFREYAYAFKGRQQLTMSPGLRDTLSVPALADDQALAGDLSGYPVLLALLSPEQWGRVLRVDARAHLLRVAASGDFEQLQAFLADLPE